MSVPLTLGAGLTHLRSTLASIHASAIQDRMDLLQSILQDSQFPPERANIEAAIAGYESGAIPYSDSYTLIWAGRVVDQCPDYESFSIDRNARLDRYEAEYGPGWLWYEPPLSEGEGAILAKKGLCLEDDPLWRTRTESIGHYRLQMGFRRRKARVAREFPKAQRPAPRPAPRKPARQRRRSNFSRAYGKPGASTTTAKASKSNKATASSLDPDDDPEDPDYYPESNPAPENTFPETVPDPDGPRIMYETLLDSGATLPCLFTADLPQLGIHPTRYAAQSARRIATADSVSTMRVYELDVGIYAPDGSSLINPRPDDPSSPSKTLSLPHTPFHPLPNHPFLDPSVPLSLVDFHDLEPPVLGSVLPVVALPGQANSDFDARLAPDRLSGLLPFHVCYVSSAPGNFKMWLGSGRRDVLGAGRLPGMRRWGGWWWEDRGRLGVLEELLDGEVEEHNSNARGVKRKRGEEGGTKKRPTKKKTEDGEEEGEEVQIDPEQLLGLLEDDPVTPRKVVFEQEIIAPDGTRKVVRDEEEAGRGRALRVSAARKRAGSEDLHHPPAAAGINEVRVEPPRKTPAKKAVKQPRGEGKRVMGGRKGKET